MFRLARKYLFLGRGCENYLLELILPRGQMGTHIEDLKINFSLHLPIYID
jgi:hypothetical protein